MTFICCWRHLEAALVTEAAEIKSRSEDSKLHGGTEVISAVITIQAYQNGKCQVCGSNSLFSVYFQETYRMPAEQTTNAAT